MTTHTQFITTKLQKKTIVEDNGCWKYTGGRTGAGYGAVWVSGKTLSAHTVSYELHKGPVPKGLCVLHSCDNKLCINPDHLFLGTVQDNKKDEVSKDRHAKGQAQGNSKLTEFDIIQIRNLIKEQKHSLNEIGKLYGVTGEAIGLIKSRKNWGWLQ